MWECWDHFPGLAWTCLNHTWTGHLVLTIQMLRVSYFNSSYLLSLSSCIPYVANRIDHNRYNYGTFVNLEMWACERNIIFTILDTRFWSALARRVTGADDPSNTTPVHLGQVPYSVPTMATENLYIYESVSWNQRNAGTCWYSCG